MDLIFTSHFPIKSRIHAQILFLAMDDTRDSNIERPVDIGLDVRPVQSMTDYFLVKRAVTLWTFRRFSTYNSYATRLQTFEDRWAADKRRTPHSLSEAGFYYDCEIYTIIQIIY